MPPPENLIVADSAAGGETGPPPVRETTPSNNKATYDRRRRHHVTYLVVSVVVLALALVLQVRGSEEVVLPQLGVPLPPVCTMRRVTGLNCPGCGLTRSFILLARGDLVGAWHFNPAGLLFFALTVAQVPYRSWQLWRLGQGRASWDHPWLSNLIWLLLGAALLQWAWRLIVSE